VVIEMALDAKVYEALEQIVGEKNISQEAVILDAYARQYQSGAEALAGGLYNPIPEAVLLPGSTEEVQAIQKICNRFKVPSKAMSTGWGSSNNPGKGGIQLDLRRMNRILEIDEENMYAVVEPYVTCAQIQAEAMKKGLNTNIIGGGSSTSLLASATSMAGHGLSGVSMGYGGRNLLAFEWVMPTGDILRAGSLGSGAGWFCGDGPGPSIRGAVRGFVGAMGGLGIFTKAAVKLYPWPGPGEWQPKGVTPNYYVELPETIRTYTIAFPDRDAFAEAWYKLGESGICYVLGREVNAFGERMKVPYFVAMVNPALNNDDIPALLESPDIQQAIDELKVDLQVTIAAHSQNDLEYKQKALDKILTDTGASIHPLFSDPGAEELMHVLMIRVDRNNAVFDMCGSFSTSFGFLTVVDTLRETIDVGAELKREHSKQGGILDDGGDAMWGSLYEQGAIGGHLEEIVQYDPHNMESNEGVFGFVTATTIVCAARGWPGGLGAVVMVPAMTGAETMGMEVDPTMKKEIEKMVESLNLTPIIRFQTKIKKAFDPNGASSSFGLATMEDSEEG